MIEVYTVQQVSEILQICKDTVYDLINQGKLKSIRLGKSIRVPQRFLEEYLYGQVPYDLEIGRKIEELESKLKQYEELLAMLKLVKR